MNNIIFRCREYIIVKQYENKYMIINTKKEFKNGHTHINNLQYGKLMIFILVEKQIKNKRHLRLLHNKHFIESLYRIANNPEQVEKIIRRSQR